MRNWSSIPGNTLSEEPRLVDDESRNHEGKKGIFIAIMVITGARK